MWIIGVPVNLTAGVDSLVQYGETVSLRCPVISDLDYFGLVILDANR